MARLERHERKRSTANRPLNRSLSQGLARIRARWPFQQRVPGSRWSKKQSPNSVENSGSES